MSTTILSFVSCSPAPLPSESDSCPLSSFLAMSGVGPGGSRLRRPGQRDGAPAGRDGAEGIKVGCMEVVALGTKRKTERYLN